MFIVEFKNGGDPFWLTGGNIGDPPRTVVKTSAKKYKSNPAAKAALTRAINRNPSLDIQNWEIEIIDLAKTK